MMNLNDVVTKIKENVYPDMESWKTEFRLFIKDLERYCTFDVWKDESLIGLTILQKDSRIAILKEKKGYTKSMNVFFGRTTEQLNQLIEKVAEAKLAKIDRAVYKKLDGVNVHEINQVYFNAEGEIGCIEGAWKINNEKTLSFKSVYAGGYNIQTLHVRTIVKYK
jgi:hypothetical protein